MPEEDGPYIGRARRDPPSGLLPRDEFNLTLEQQRGLGPSTRGRTETASPYGHHYTWLSETIRTEHGEYWFLQRIGTGIDGAPEALQMVFPPKVTAMLTRQSTANTNKARSRAAKQAAATRKAKGIEPAFLKRKKR